MRQKVLKYTLHPEENRAHIKFGLNSSDKSSSKLQFNLLSALSELVAFVLYILYTHMSFKSHVSEEEEKHSGYSLWRHHVLRFIEDSFGKKEKN